jgi:diadenosine tetraphosphatase ApaH/serine/threonine PP2A family protein phosphatase
MAKKGQAPHQPKDGETLTVRGSKLIVNPGSVGQPRDNDPRAAFAIYDVDQRIITFRRIAYDVATTQAQMEEAGLPRPLVTRLALGV